MLQYFWAAPPIARTLTLATFTFSVAVYTGIFPYRFFPFTPKSFLQLPPELWRLVTPFFLTGPRLAIFFETYFLYTYTSKNEIASPRFTQRADFVTYICFVSSVILGLNIFIGGSILSFALVLAFMTTYTMDSWDQPTSIFGIVTIPAQYLPYIFLFVTFILSGPTEFLILASGVCAAHFYNLLTGQYAAYGGPSWNLIPTPAFMFKLFGKQAEVQRPYGTVLNANMASGSTGNGVGASAWGISWGKWGKGQRLGGDAEAAGGVQQERGRSMVVLAVVVFVVISCVLGMVFMWYRDPEGWWNTLKEGLFGGPGEMAGTSPM